MKNILFKINLCKKYLLISYLILNNIQLLVIEWIK